MYACVYAPGYDDEPGARQARAADSSVQNAACSALIVVAQQFSPRYETRGDLVIIDVRGLDRLFGNMRTIADELRREAADHALRAHVAIAGTQTAAAILAIARLGVTVIDPEQESATSASIADVPLDVLAKIDHAAGAAISVFKHWGLRTFGDVAALPPDELSARMGPPGLTWHAITRGVDVRPLVPDVEAERFEASLDLEWPIEGLEPLSFVLTRLLEPLSLRLEARDRGVAVLHLQLRLVTKDIYERRLELPTPMRDVKTLRTLALLDLEAHPPSADAIAIDRVGIVIEPTLGRVWQHTLFARPHPTPEQLSTLLARLAAAMGQDRVGAPVLLDTYRPGAFSMKPFATKHDDDRGRKPRRENNFVEDFACSAVNAVAVRRCRQPIPAVVAVNDTGTPVNVITHRRGFAGGTVLRASGPWKTSGEWWLTCDTTSAERRAASNERRATSNEQRAWDRDEWDVALSDGASYRIFLDRAADGWFVDAILD